MTKIACLMIGIVLAVTSVPAEEPPMSGGVYQISTASHWKWLVDNNQGTQTMSLVSSFAFATNGSDYGSFASFSGTFNGGSNSITIPDGVTVTNELFGTSMGGLVRDLTVNIQGTLYSTRNIAGALCGVIGGTLQDVTVNITGRGCVYAANRTGGLCGEAGGGTLRRCRLVVDETTPATVSIKNANTPGWDNVASLVAFQNAVMKIEDCTVELKTGTMQASAIGGLVGVLNYSGVMTFSNTTLVIGTNMVFNASAKGCVSAWGNGDGNCVNVNVLTPLDSNPLGDVRANSFARFSYDLATELPTFRVPGVVEPNPLTWTNGPVRAPPGVIDAGMSYNGTVYTGVGVTGGVIRVTSDCSAETRVPITVRVVYGASLPFSLEYRAFRYMPPGMLILIE